MARRTNSVPRPRVLAPRDWIAAAMDALVEGGVSAVAIEAIAARLGTTKSSFYHHFKNRDALIKAALEEWERRDTLEVRERLEQISDPRARIYAVMTAAITDREGGVRDAALMASGKHPLVRPIVERATQLRIRYLTDTYVQLGLSRAQAGRRAVLTSVAYLGLYEYIRGLDVEVSNAELVAYADELLARLVPAANPVAA